MNEIQLLNKTLCLINDEDTSNAYDFLINNKDNLDSISSQVYNFLYCLAATSNKKEEALGWLEEAIIIEGLWYRLEVFEDEDLDTIRMDKRFEVCYKKSEERYLEALKGTRSICTWDEKKNDRLILSLHGNQQNNKISKEHWDFLKGDKFQVEYIQSKEIDSYQLFRWEDKGSGAEQLNEIINSIDWNLYEERILCGFSSGCNIILKAIRDYNITCDKIILQSPWIAVVEEDLVYLIEQLKTNNIEVIIICGEEDKDCLPQCKLLEVKALDMGLNINSIYIEKLGHDYPEMFNKIVQQFIK